VILSNQDIYQMFRKIVDLKEIYPLERLGMTISRIICTQNDLTIIKTTQTFSDKELRMIIRDQLYLIVATLLINGYFHSRLNLLYDLLEFLNPSNSKNIYVSDDLILICLLPLLITCLKYTGHIDPIIKEKVNLFEHFICMFSLYFYSPSMPLISLRRN
jgi:hypothetical protein